MVRDLASGFAGGMIIEICLSALFKDFVMRPIHLLGLSAVLLAGVPTFAPNNGPAGGLPTPVNAAKPAAPHAARPAAPASTPESRSAAALALSHEPTYDEGTAQRIKEAALGDSDMAVGGGWAMNP